MVYTLAQLFSSGWFCPHTPLDLGALQHSNTAVVVSCALYKYYNRVFLHCSIERSQTSVWFQYLLLFQTENPSLDLYTPLLLWLYFTKGT